MKTNECAPSFADIMHRKNKETRTGKFLERVNQLVDFSFTKRIHEQLHPEEIGRSPYSCETLFKIILLQQWYGLSDAETEELIYDRDSFKEFLKLTCEDDIPDETTICRFRQALTKDRWDESFFEEVERQLSVNNVLVTHGKIVDATICEAPKGRKKKDGTTTRDTDASFTKKNNRSYHGYKNTTATDTVGEFIKKCHTSTAKDHDSQHEDKVLDGDERAVFEDSAYANKEKKIRFRKEGKFYGIVERSYRGRPLSLSQKKRNRKISSVRCRGEHPYAEIKCRLKFRVRYKGLRKNEWHFRMTAAAYNLKRWIGKIFPAQKRAVVWCSWEG